MVNNNIKTINAFSLTEVLVTMFIIMLVIIASTPMITKKNVKNKNPHGIWECYLNEQGEHVSKTTLDKQAPQTKVDGDYCVFSPQKNAKSYTVVVIGGGGGGASGTAFSRDAISYNSPVNYQVPTDGQYAVLLVGGGGGGSAYQGYKGAKGGGAGGVNSFTINLDKNEYIVLEAGMGGTRGGGVGDSGEDSSSSDECTGENQVAWSDKCKGEDGKESKLYRYVNSQTYTAAGGKAAGTNVGTAGAGAIGSSVNGSNDKGGKLDYTTESLGKFINATDKSAISFGSGGNGYYNAFGGQGFPGVAMIVSNAHHAGAGGKRGTSAYVSLNKITETVKVYVGKGGEGAVNEDTNGKQGENSSFGFYVTAKGGEGGKARIKSSTNSTALDGEPGDISPYGDQLKGGGTSKGNLNGKNDMDVNEGIVQANETQYGAGGGGGSSLARGSVNASSQDCWGKGGRGMPGYVRVEWN